MLREERINAIASYVDQIGTASLPELAKQFKVSTNTLRRDIAQLVAENRLKKIYGGVTSVHSDDPLSMFAERQPAAAAAKTQIGRLAVDLIAPNDLIFIDSGTTTAALAKILPTDFPYTVVTNSLIVINAVARLANVKLMLVGANFDRRTESFTEIPNPELFARFNINKAFMAATGVSLTQGISNSEYNEYIIKRELFARAKQRYLLIDHRKFDRVSLLSYGAVADLTGVITDQTPPPAYRRFFLDHHIEWRDATGVHQG